MSERTKEWLDGFRDGNQYGKAQMLGLLRPFRAAAGRLADAVESGEESRIKVELNEFRKASVSSNVLLQRKDG